MKLKKSEERHMGESGEREEKGENDVIITLKTKRNFFKKLERTMDLKKISINRHRK